MKQFILTLILFIKNPRDFIRLKIKLPLAKFIYDTIELSKSRAQTGVNNIKDVLFRGSVIALITALLVWLSIFMYVAFYYAYVPSIAHEKPIHLGFESCDKWDIHKSICSFPSGKVQLTDKQRLLMSGQPYKVFLDLEMPESPTNRELGMFMVCVDFYGPDEKIITKSCRSAMLHYRGFFLEHLYKLIFSPFFVFGNMEEKQTLHIELFSSYVETYDQQVTKVFIEIQTKYIELYSAKFSINANFAGLRYIMFHWPILSAAIGITSNLFFIALVSIISWYQIINSEEYLLFLKNSQKQKRFKDIKDFTDSSSDEDISLIKPETVETIAKHEFKSI